MSTSLFSGRIGYISYARRCIIFFTFLLCVANSEILQAQATLSIQGILKKANGVAVDDGLYTITFKLYTELAGTVPAIWSETQSDVEVSSGIYSAVLGQITPLTIPFNQLYYLGVTIGTSELAPRILLTSAPYALSLIGVSNQFPSSGKVVADEIQINGGVLARGGAPGVNGVNKAGYAFTGNSGDNDSGLFSTADGKVSLYSNNAEVIAVTPGAATVNGTFATSNLNLTGTGTVNYNGISSWRLVDVDDFNGTADGWQIYGPSQGFSMGWNNANGSGAPFTNFGAFAGNVLLPSDNNQVLKKNYNIAGSFTQIKVKFRYYFIDSWGFGGGDKAWAAFSGDASGSALRVGWEKIGLFLTEGGTNPDLNNTPVQTASHFVGQGYSDHWNDVEMTAQANGSSFWVFIGAAVDQDTNDERYAVGAVEIWVR